MEEDTRISAAEWYYIKNGQRLGPIPETSVRAWIESGFLKNDDLVWRSGMGDWEPIGDIPDFSPASMQGRALPSASAFSMPSPAPPVGAIGYGGFWLRAGAYLIDTLLLSMVLLIFWRPEVPPAMTMEQMLESIRRLESNVTLMVTQFLMSWFYFALMESSPWQATLGKRAFRLRVTDVEGRRITLVRASLRHFGKVVSQFTFFLGFLLAGFTPRKQALHDLLARCLVVRW